jgi:WD40 repeat protein
MTDEAWSRSQFVARPLSRPWVGRTQSVLAISPSRLIVGSGSNIYSYKFGDSRDEAAPSVLLEGMCSAVCSGNNPHITSMAFVDDGGLNQTLCVGFDDGALERLVLSFPSEHKSMTCLTISSRYAIPRPRNGDFIESLSSENDILLSLSSSGTATLTNLKSSFVPPHSTELKTRSWVSHLCLDASGPFVAFGTSSSTPLVVYSVTNNQISPTPSAILHTNSISVPNARSSSAVYGITRAPLASAWGSSPQVIVAGWYDGELRCYDLRSSSRATSSTTGPAPLRPVLSFSDPWSFEPIYSVSCGGGSASHIAAGSARHGVVSFWDVRSPMDGWSVHAPGNDPSPVYSVILESSRLYGVTQSRPFVYDFVGKISCHSFPFINDVLFSGPRNFYRYLPSSA